MVVAVFERRVTVRRGAALLAGLVHAEVPTSPRARRHRDVRISGRGPFWRWSPHLASKRHGDRCRRDQHDTEHHRQHRLLVAIRNCPLTANSRSTVA